MTAVLERGRRGLSSPASLGIQAAILLVVLVAATVMLWLRLTAGAAAPASSGFALNGQPAPNFVLTDQFGVQRSLESFRGRETVLAFVDDRCTTVCPLTAQTLRAARARLGSARSQVALVAVNADPRVTGVAAVRKWSTSHQMLHTWQFLTGSPHQLTTVYAQYRIYDRVTARGRVTHDPAIVIIDPQGRERLYFDTASDRRRATVLGEEAGLFAAMKQWLP